MRASIVTLAFFAVLAAGQAAQAQTMKIGVFDPQKILSDSRMGQSLQEELNRFRIQREAEIKKNRDELTRLMEQYKAGAETMSRERREQVEADLTQRRRDFERIVRDAEADLQRERKKGVGRIEEAVARAVEEYGRKQGYTLILQRDLCAFALDSIDISKEIVRLIDSQRLGQ